MVVEVACGSEDSALYEVVAQLKITSVFRQQALSQAPNDFLIAW
jgi:hypothetical protein